VQLKKFLTSIPCAQIGKPCDVDDRRDFAYKNRRDTQRWTKTQKPEWDGKKKSEGAPSDFYFRPSTDRSSLARFSPFRSGFLIRAIFPGRSHVNFRRPMTRQAREAQTSMIFRVFRVRVESKIPDRLNQSLSHFVCPPRHHPAPPFSRRYRYQNIVPYQRYVTICNICEETKRDGINKGGMRD